MTSFAVMANTVTHEKDPLENRCHFLAIAFNYPALLNDSSRLMTLAQSLKISVDNLFVTAAYLGKLDFFNYVSELGVRQTLAMLKWNVLKSN